MERKIQHYAGCLGEARGKPRFTIIYLPLEDGGSIEACDHCGAFRRAAPFIGDIIEVVE